MCWPPRLPDTRGIWLALLFLCLWMGRLTGTEALWDRAAVGMGFSLLIIGSLQGVLPSPVEQQRPGAKRYRQQHRQPDPIPAGQRAEERPRCDKLDLTKRTNRRHPP